MDYKRKKRSKKHHSPTVSCCTYDLPYLNDDVMLYILRYLDVKDLVRAAQVCKRWRNFVAHPSFWKTVRLRNCEITDWERMATKLQNWRTQNLDLRDVRVSNKHQFWKKFFSVVPRINSLVRLELCICSAGVVHRVFKSFPQLKVLNAMSITNCFNLKSIGNLEQCEELRLQTTRPRSLFRYDVANGRKPLKYLEKLTQLKHLSLTSVILVRSNISSIQTLTNLETLELSECKDFSIVLPKLKKLKRFRLEQGAAYDTLDILKGISKLENLTQVELVNFDITNGFDKCLANCKNIKKLLLVPSLHLIPHEVEFKVILSAENIAMILEGITNLSSTLTHFVWSVMGRNSFFDSHVFKVTNQQLKKDVLLMLKPLSLRNKKIDELIGDNRTQEWRRFLQKFNLHCPISPQLLELDFLSLPQLQDLFSLALPNSRVEMLNYFGSDARQYKFSDT